jgi:hypothetical protein
MSNGIILLGENQIELNISIPFQGPRSIASANAILIEWMRNVEQANRLK